uniref:Uncharacterized protein n=1 Tax=Daphnia galeata TaxID=27404 RepID=A0A8J2S121_9CRUS|nr:unnamed protein product [Daphnia galeata]
MIERQAIRNHLNKLSPEVYANLIDTSNSHIGFEKARMTVNTIMAKARVKNKKSMRYEANWLLECLNLRIKSCKVYDHLFRSGILPLPHPNTLCSLLGEMSLAMPEEPRLVNMFSSFFK